MMDMGDEEKQKWTGNTVTDCFLIWGGNTGAKEKGGQDRE